MPTKFRERLLPYLQMPPLTLALLGVPLVMGPDISVWPSGGAQR